MCVPVTLAVGRLSDNLIALLDTGASISAVHPDLIKTLNPPVIGRVDYAQVGALVQRVDTYYLKVAIDKQYSIGVEVIAAVPSSPCQMLIGRDLMSR